MYSFKCNLSDMSINENLVTLIWGLAAPSAQIQKSTRAHILLLYDFVHALSLLILRLDLTSVVLRGLSGEKPLETP